MSMMLVTEDVIVGYNNDRPKRGIVNEIACGGQFASYDHGSFGGEHVGSAFLRARISRAITVHSILCCPDLSRGPTPAHAVDDLRSRGQPIVLILKEMQLPSSPHTGWNSKLSSTGPT